jgi:transposase-like protein
MLYCPICNSTDIWMITGGCTGRIYRCKRCGYQGALVIEYREEDEGKDER